MQIIANKLSREINQKSFISMKLFNNTDTQYIFPCFHIPLPLLAVTYIIVVLKYLRDTVVDRLSAVVGYYYIL